MKIHLTIFPRFGLGVICLALGWAGIPSAVAQTWVTNSPLQVARWAHTSTTLGDRTVLIAGGILYNMNGDFANRTCQRLHAKSPWEALNLRDEAGFDTPHFLGLNADDREYYEYNGEMFADNEIKLFRYRNV